VHGAEDFPAQNLQLIQLFGQQLVGNLQVLLTDLQDGFPPFFEDRIHLGIARILHGHRVHGFGRPHLALHVLVVVRLQVQARGQGTDDGADQPRKKESGDQAAESAETEKQEIDHEGDAERHAAGLFPSVLPVFPRLIAHFILPCFHTNALFLSTSKV
jgi:hypothetical protein